VVAMVSLFFFAVQVTQLQVVHFSLLFTQPAMADIDTMMIRHNRVFFMSVVLILKTPVLPGVDFVITLKIQYNIECLPVISDHHKAQNT